MVLSGRVDEAEEAMRIMRVAEAYYVGEGGTAGGGAASGCAAGGSGGNSGAAGGADPSGGRVINNLTISGVQTVLLHVKVLKVSRTKLRTGFDFAQLANSGGSIPRRESPTWRKRRTDLGHGHPVPYMTLGTNPTMAFRVVGAGGSFFGFLKLSQRTWSRCSPNQR